MKEEGHESQGVHRRYHLLGDFTGFSHPAEDYFPMVDGEGVGYALDCVDESGSGGGVCGVDSC